MEEQKNQYLLTQVKIVEQEQQEVQAVVALTHIQVQVHQVVEEQEIHHQLVHHKVTMVVMAMLFQVDQHNKIHQAVEVEQQQ